MQTSCPYECWAPDPKPFYTALLLVDISFVQSKYFPYLLLAALQERKN